MSRRKRTAALLESPSLRRGALPAVIRKGGFELTMIKRVGRVAIYRQHLPGGNPDHDAYEVILAQVRNTDHRRQPVEPYEGYPPAESWGKKGWTFSSLAKAVQKLKQFAQKASRTGTVSRRNRFNGRRSHGGRIPAMACKSVTILSGPLCKGARTGWRGDNGLPSDVYSATHNLATR
jgi:hypothetical protein